MRTTCRLELCTAPNHAALLEDEAGQKLLGFRHYRRSFQATFNLRLFRVRQYTHVPTLRSIF